MKPSYLKIRFVLGLLSLVIGLLAANLAFFGWINQEGFLYFLGDSARYVCAFGGFAAIIFGSMLINDFLITQKKDLRKNAIWFQEAAFEEGKMFLGQFFLDSKEEKEIAKQKI